ncbi:serine hydrolase [Companilactobacillus kimchiensis]|uniref:Beta-lactamase n=1 Tax=Companilactobacillus kimchiensis TaxID=993692 RepID=A0A0R2LNF7_9LACO|nr:serine hydrolase [Companilactobacillus kimchiensis]KRN99876.1 beta-lactamase [Companilactobacillus kimchiensis]
MKKCPKCEHQNPDDSSFCEKCGHSLADVKHEDITKNDQQKCPKCGHKNIPGAKFCEHCSFKLDTKPAIVETKSEQKPDPYQCPKCGHKNPQGSTFCESCGQKLADTKKTTQNNSNKTIPEPRKPIVQKTPETSKPLKPKTDTSESKINSDVKKAPKITSKPKQSNRTNLFIIDIVVLVLIIGGGSYLALHRNNQEEADNSTNVQKTTPKTTKTNVDSDNTDTDSVSANEIHSILADNLGSLAGTNGAYYYNLNDHVSSGMSENTKIRAASDIKLFIMAVAFQKIDDGDLSLSDRYTLTDDDKVGGTGIVQSMQSGTSLTYKDLINYMITQSDNTAANIITDKVGGLSAVNEEITKLDLNHTDMQRKLMDQDALDEGRDNYSTAKDLGTFLTKLYQHNVVSKKYDNQMLDIMANDSNHTKLPSRINTDVVTVYNKTGEYDKYGVQNDAAIFKRGKKAFVIVVMSENGKTDDQKDAMGDLGAALAKKVFDN